GLVERLRGADERRLPVVQAHRQVTARERNEHFALAVRRRRDGDRARPRRLRLPHAALPHAGDDVAGPVDARDLHVGALREARMRFEPWADLRQVLRVALAARVRVADVDRREADAVRLLRDADADGADVLLDLVAAEHPGHDRALADADRDRLGPRAGGQPAGGDASGVA